MKAGAPDQRLRLFRLSAQAMTQHFVKAWPPISSHGRIIDPAVDLVVGGVDQLLNIGMMTPSSSRNIIAAWR